MNAAREDIAAVRHNLDAMADTLGNQLPPHIPASRFIAAVMTAVQKNPDLLGKCDRASLYLACKDAAEDGLLPDGREGAIVPHKGKATWMPMVAGLVKLAWQCGHLASLHADAAYEGEPFEVWGGSDARVVHRYDLARRGSGSTMNGIVAVYAVAKLTSGETMQAVLTPGEVAKIRALSKAANGPWGPWPVQMAIVRAVRRLTKLLPLASDREADARMRRAAERGDEIDGASEDVSARIEPTAHIEGGKLAQLEHEIAGPDPLAGLSSFLPLPVSASQEAEEDRGERPQEKSGSDASPPAATVKAVDARCIALRTATLEAFNAYISDPKQVAQRAALREKYPALSDQLEAGVAIARKRLNEVADAEETAIFGETVT